jgi:pimeloyl-ACP methyl ester carboxylesterase
MLGGLGRRRRLRGLGRRRLLRRAEALHAAISGSRLVVLPDAGHVCNVEAPKEFNDAVREFLRVSRS